VIYLHLDDLLHVAGRTLDEVAVRDVGLLVAAAGRPAASAYGEDAYPTVHEKAAALLHSIAANRALVDGNKRLALAAAIVFLGVNGVRFTLTNDEVYDLVYKVVSGEIDDVAAIATVLRKGSRRRR
jgi:death-on-curing protein